MEDFDVGFECFGYFDGLAQRTRGIQGYHERPEVSLTAIREDELVLLETIMSKKGWQKLCGTIQP